MPFLGIDTATARASIALAAGGGILAEVPLAERGAHARDLLVRLEELLAGRGLGPADLHGIGVATGPGSFTGVRVGMATAKGLGYALGVPCAGLSTLEALARAAAPFVAPEGGIVCPVLDAGRGEVYAALFRIESGAPVRAGEDRSWRPPELLQALPGEAVLAGDGAGALLRLRPRLRMLEPCPLLAGAIALWVAERVRPGGGYGAGALRPNYVRPADAEAGRRRS